MAASDIVAQGMQTVKANTPEILTVLGVTGVMTTSYLVGKAAFRASEIIMRNESVGGMHGTKWGAFKERFKATWPLYIPAAISGTVTMVCIVGASKAEAKRTTAAVAAYSVTQKAFSDYKEKVVEQIGVTKEEKARAAVAQDNVNNRPPSNQIVINGSGPVLCCEMFTMRYFRSDMETLRKATNDINAKINRRLYVTLDEFYDLIGLAHTTESGNIGWDSDKQLELYFTTVMTDQQEPALAFEYNYTKPLQ